MKKITAAEARKIAHKKTTTKKIKEALAYAREKIAKEAEKGHFHAHLTSEFWEREGYYRTQDYVSAENALKRDGFSVSFYYKVHSIVVEMYTIISWEDKD